MAHKVAAKPLSRIFSVKFKKDLQLIIDRLLGSGKSVFTTFYLKFYLTYNLFIVRIVEFEKNAPASAGIFGKVNIEFWDVSGDWRYERCWGPIQKGAHGIIFVLDPGSPTGEDQLVQFQRNFMQATGL